MIIIEIMLKSSLDHIHYIHSLLPYSCRSSLVSSYIRCTPNIFLYEIYSNSVIIYYLLIDGDNSNSDVVISCEVGKETCEENLEAIARFVENLVRGFAMSHREAARRLNSDPWLAKPLEHLSAMLYSILEDAEECEGHANIVDYVDCNRREMFEVKMIENCNPDIPMLFPYYEIPPLIPL